MSLHHLFKLTILTSSFVCNFAFAVNKAPASACQKLSINYFNGFAPCKSGNKMGVVDKQGNIVIPPKYDWVEKFEDGLAGVRLDGKWGFVNTKNKVIIPFIYDSVLFFREGFVPVSQAKKWGVIDKSNRVIIPFEYEEISEVYSNLVIVKKNNKKGAINLNGKQIIPVNFDELVFSDEDIQATVMLGEKEETHIFDYEGSLIEILK